MFRFQHQVIKMSELLGTRIILFLCFVFIPLSDSAVKRLSVLHYLRIKSSTTTTTTTIPITRTTTTKTTTTTTLGSQCECETESLSHPGCGRIPTSSTIINGSPASYPWMVFFYMNNNTYSSFCGGILISDLQILSAAHCFKGTSIDEVKPISYFAKK